MWSCRKRRAASLWIDYVWSPTAVVEAPARMAPGAIMHQGQAETTYFMGLAEICCHRAETEAYLQNLESSAPGLYVVLRKGAAKGNSLPWHIHTVTASPYEAQACCDSDEDIVERVAMPPRISAAVRTFIKAHPVSPPADEKETPGCEGTEPCPDT
ncbi:DUF3305 domain-containing protein [Roseibium salinum]|nr:DUF3305 domain-containing protein [Roseibium salinum]